MKISLNWLSDYIDVAPLKKNLKEVLEKLTYRGLEVENITDLSKGFEKVIVAEILERNKHPNADRLSVCMVNISTDTSKKEILQIVCGAQNMKAGDRVCLSMVGAHLPNGAKIEKGKIRDVESFGMLCSEVELGLADSSEGILILPKDAPIGKNIGEYLKRNDVVFEINVTPNRGDALSYIGVAREIASITNQKIKFPIFDKFKEETKKASDKIKVTIEDSVQKNDLCLQYHARYIENIKVAPSPEWMQTRLKSIGLRPINNIVDITNFVLMEWGTPLHAFDYNRVKNGTINVRYGKKGEKLPLLDKSEIILNDMDLVIADPEKSIALAGIMGGGNSEVTDTTTSILLEAAQFAPGTVRRSSKTHQKKSDSSHRFERQIDSQAVSIASQRAASLIQELSGGKIFSGTVSAYSQTGKKNLEFKGVRKCKLDVKKLNRFLGTSELSLDLTKKLLQEIEFKSEVKSEILEVSIPSFRPDVEMEQDLFEEVLRVWGYDKVEPKVPSLHHLPESTSAVDLRAGIIQKIKSVFVINGFSEAMNYAFTSKDKNTFWGGEKCKEFIVELANPLNLDFAVMKTNLVCGLFDNLKNAFHHQQNDARFFEIRPVYFKNQNSETGVLEEWRIAALLTGRAYKNKLAALDDGVDFHEMKGVLETILDCLGIRGLRLEAIDANETRFHPAQSAKILLGKGNCGVVGRIHPQIEIENKIKTPIFVLELSLDRILELVKTERKYSAIPKFPKVTRDFSLIVPEEVAAEKIIQATLKHGKPLMETVQIVDLYKGDKIESGKMSLSIAMVLADPNRTLEEKEVEVVLSKVLSGLDKDLGVKLRSQ